MAEISDSGIQMGRVSDDQLVYSARSKQVSTVVRFAGVGKSFWGPVSRFFSRIFEEHQEWLPRQKLKLAGYIEAKLNKLRQIFAAFMMVLSTAIPMPDNLYNRLCKDYFFSPRKVVDLKFREYPELSQKVSVHAFQLTPGAPDIQMIHSFYLPAKPGEFTYIFFHGRDTNLGHLEHLFKVADEKGVGMFAIDYPGFGKSDGSPGEAQAKLAGLAGTRFLAGDGYHGGLNVPYEKTRIIGYSMGGGVASYVAEQFAECMKDPMKKTFNLKNKQQPGGLILVNTFTSIPELFCDKLSEQKNWLVKRLAKWFDPKRINIKFNSGEAVKNVSMPIRVFHCANDHTVPKITSQKLADAAQVGKSEDVKCFNDLAGENHNLKEPGVRDIFWRLAQDKYEVALGTRTLNLPDTGKVNQLKFTQG